MFKYIFAGFILFNLGFINAVEVQKPKLDGTPVCEICTVVLSAAQTLLKQNHTADEVIQLIEKDLCSRLGALSSTCSQYVEQYGPTIIYMLAQDINPSLICNHLGLCQTMIVDPHPIIHPISDTLNCTLCKLVFTQVQNALKNNASEEQLLQFIEKTLCNATGSFSSTCKTLIDTYGPSILKYLAQGVDPSKLCELIGMCTKSSHKLHLLKEKSKFAKIHKIKKMHKMAEIRKEFARKEFARNELYCTMCQYTMQFIDVELKKNHTEQSIVNVLDSVCKIAPASTQKECEAMINTYGIYLVELLIQFADPLKVCQAIKLC